MYTYHLLLLSFPSIMCINSKAYNGNQGEVVCVTSSGLQIVTHSSKPPYFLLSPLPIKNHQKLNLQKIWHIPINNFSLFFIY